MTTATPTTKVTSVDNGLYWFDSEAISYALFDRDCLSLHFTNGRDYEYYGVSPDTWVGLISSDSIGRFFNQHIRDQYSYA